MSWTLPEAFDLEPSGEIVAFVGGGGKTSLMFALAEAFPGRAVTTTTTRIFTAQMKLASAIYIVGEATRGGGEAIGATASLEGLGSLLALHRHCLVVGRVAGEKAIGVPPGLPAQLLARPDVDIVLVEADGSRMKPCKAPADHEPVMPAGATAVVPVVGIDALGKRLKDAAHRPELVAALTGFRLDDRVTVETLAELIVHPAGGMKGLPPGARFVPLINKVESAGQLAAARQMAKQILGRDRVDRVVIGALKSQRPVVEVHRRVVAVVLAAGESERMGRTKQLLPWGQTTMLGQTLANLKASAVNEILVVAGHDAASVEASVAESKVPVIHNPEYASGEMLSSLQAAIRQLPINMAAVLVVLADQPLVEPETIDRILAAFWESKAEIVAPTYQGKRGNPVLIGRSFFDELLALPAGSAPRHLLQAHPGAIHSVEVPSPSILLDLDSPAQYERWRPKD